jgi:hypothetical protein
MNLRPPSFKPLRFVPASKKDEILDKDVFWVDAVAHERLPQGGNYWCFYLRVSATHSIHLDMTPSYTVPSTSVAGGSKGNLVVSLLDYTVSPSAQKVVRLDVLTGRTVRDYVSLLVEHGRDKYEFNDQGQGCRYWVDQQIDLFYQHGFLVSRAQIEEARAAILTQWPGRMQYPLVQGGYYQ